MISPTGANAPQPRASDRRSPGSSACVEQRHLRPRGDDERVAANERRHAGLAARLSEDQRLAEINLALKAWPPSLRRRLLGIDLTPDDQGERQDLLDGLEALSVARDQLYPPSKTERRWSIEPIRRPTRRRSA
jgi:hypothetical protein